MARPTLLDDDRHRELVSAVRAGVPWHVAASAAGIGESTLRLWRQKGREEAERRQQGLPPNDAYDPYVALLADLTQAERRGEASLVVRWAGATTAQTVTVERRVEKVDAEGNVLEATVTTETREEPGDWRAARDLLAIRYPDRWARQDRVEVVGSRDAPPIQVETTAERRERVEVILAEVSGRLSEQVVVASATEDEGGDGDGRALPSG